MPACPERQTKFSSSKLLSDSSPWSPSSGLVEFSDYGTVGLASVLGALSAFALAVEVKAEVPIFDTASRSLTQEKEWEEFAGRDFYHKGK